jgi:hypothetical protein
MYSHHKNWEKHIFQIKSVYMLVGLSFKASIN